MTQYHTGMICKTCGKEIISDNSLWSLLLQPGYEKELASFRSYSRECQDCDRKGLERVEKRVIRQEDYREYLNSDHWKKTRAAALQRAGNKCQGCGGTYDLQVHHKTYARRGHERPEDLEVLCRNCHKDEHGITFG